MADKIQADYEQLASVSSSCSQLAANADQLLQRTMTCVGNLQGGGWKGAAADAFYAEMGDLVQPGVRRLIDALTEATTSINQIIQLIQESETNASGRFKTIGGNGPKVSA